MKSLFSRANEVTESILAAESVRTSLGYSVIALAQGRFEREATLDTVDEIISANDEITTAVDWFRATDAVAGLDPIFVAFMTGQSTNKHLEIAVNHLNGLSGLMGSLQGTERGVRASLQSELDAIEETIEDAITADA